MSTTPFEHPSAENSTNVRTQKRPSRPRHARAPYAVRAPVALMERWSPEWLARAAMPLMFRTRRHEAPAWEKELLRTARPLELWAPRRVRAWTWGAAGPTVLLVHGWNGRGTQLGAFVAPLVERGYKVVALDAPGHGASPGSGASIFHFADAIDAALDATRPLFGPARAVIAHSFGGAATTLAMSRRLREPTTPLERALEPRRLPAERFVFVAPPIDVRDWIGTFAWAIGAGPRLEEALRKRIEDRFGVPLASLYAPALARDIDAPMLLVHDEEDRDVPVERGRLLAASWSGAELLVTRGLGHTRILKEPTVVERVVDFVTR